MMLKWRGVVSFKECRVSLTAQNRNCAQGGGLLENTHARTHAHSMQSIAADPVAQMVPDGGCCVVVEDGSTIAVGARASVAMVADVEAALA